MRIEALHGDELREVEGHDGESLYTALRRAGMPLLSVCGGRASCGACRIQVMPGWWARLPPALETERQLLAVLPGRREGDRLSCQVTLAAELDGLMIRVRVKSSSRGVSA
ncbi:MAG: 2Fe-2S iron-sulfur cluster-binding protein [Steroidobacteraceae bacterium]